jgi:hypothetical protein
MIPTREEIVSSTSNSKRTRFDSFFVPHTTPSTKPNINSKWKKMENKVVWECMARWWSDANIYFNTYCYRTICTLIKGKVKGEQIGVIGDYPITVNSIGCLFLFRVVGPGETSPMTWGFEKARSKWLNKDPLLQVTTDQKVSVL